MTGPSKVAGMRAMREARHAEQSRPGRAEKKPPRTELQREIDMMIDPPKPKEDVKPAKPAPNVATKRKKRTAEVIGKTRAGKVQISIWISDELNREMRIAMAEDGQRLESWLDMAIRQELKARVSGS